jgi:toxic protein SymE
VEQEKKIRPSGKRKLSVYTKHFRRAYKNFIIFPEIRLCGKWLRDIGFDCGQPITVRYKENKIIITVDEKEAL